MKPNLSKLAELQTRNLYNPALAALRRACSGSGRETIVEVPTARALADREHVPALVSYPVPMDAPTLRAMADNARALALKLRTDAETEAASIEARARKYELEAAALERR